jgi:hypothetical protein
VRPILDRMDYALTRLLDGYTVSPDTGYEVPLPRPATQQEWLTEFRDASKGAQPPITLTGRKGARCYTGRSVPARCWSFSTRC